MKLLHHPESELSRTLLATMPEGVEVIDWTQPHDYDGPPPSAFPSVVALRPATEQYVPECNGDGELLGVVRTACDEYEEIIRTPVSWEAVHDYLTYL